MREPDKDRITRLLKRMNEGDEDAGKELFSIIYKKLHRKAKYLIKKRRPESIYQTTDLVHDLYLKLGRVTNQNWKDREHFFKIAFLAMRQILQLIYRNRKAIKRGGNRQREPLEDGMITLHEKFEILCDGRNVMEKLAEVDQSWAQVVELHCYGELTLEEIAKIQNITLSRVIKKWNVAYRWLRRELKVYNQHDRNEHDDNK